MELWWPSRSLEGDSLLEKEDNLEKSRAKRQSKFTRTLSEVLAPTVPHVILPLIYVSVFLAMPQGVFHATLALPRSGMEPCPLQWKHGVLTAGLPGKAIPLTF